VWGVRDWPAARNPRDPSVVSARVAVCVRRLRSDRAQTILRIWRGHKGVCSRVCIKDSRRVWHRCRVFEAMPQRNGGPTSAHR
jgi:hypothetical protein